MKYLFSVLFALTITSCYTQDGSEERISSEKIYQVVDRMPEYPGGMTEMINFVAENLKYPAIKGNQLEGVVFVEFIINDQGNVEDVGILEGMNEVYNKEAMRVISKFPTWTPGENEGVKVKVQLTLPIKFKL